MRKFLVALLGAATVGVLSFGGTPAQAGTCPALGIATDCDLIITFSNKGAVTTLTGQPPYDGVEDQLIGVVNNSTSAITHFVITGSSGAFSLMDGDGIMHFNGGLNDGLCTVGSNYCGPDNHFAAVNFALEMGTVVFPLGLAPGAKSYFSLEEPASLNFTINGIPELSTWAMMIIGFAGVGLQLHRRKSGAYASA